MCTYITESKGNKARSLSEIQFSCSRNKQSSVTCKEWLREVEAGDPEHWRNSIINPVLEELQSINTDQCDQYHCHRHDICHGFHRLCYHQHHLIIIIIIIVHIKLKYYTETILYRTKDVHVRNSTSQLRSHISQSLCTCILCPISVSAFLLTGPSMTLTYIQGHSASPKVVNKWVQLLIRHQLTCF